MDHDRTEITGTFNNGLLMGASHGEQYNAGVNAHDDAFTAGMKVSNKRMYDDLAARGHPVTSGSSTPSYGLVYLVILLVFAGLAFVVWNASLYTPPASQNWVDPKGFAIGSRDPSQRQADYARFAHLFKADAPAALFWKGCKDPVCLRPDLQAFDRFKPYAANPARYESDLCNHVVGAKDYPAGLVEPVWNLNRKTSYCEMANGRQVYQSASAVNRPKVAWPILVMALGITLVVLLSRLGAGKK